MADPTRFRDSTEILLPADALDGVEAELRERFTLTIHREGRRVRIIGSPVEIKDASDFLARNGVSLA